jgi:hypothetical protein
MVPKKVLADAETGVVKLRKELAKLGEQVATSEVRKCRSSFFTVEA